MASFTNVVCVKCNQLPTHGVQNAGEADAVYCWECFIGCGLSGENAVPLADSLSNIIEKMKSAGITACPEGCGHLIVNSEDALSHADNCPNRKLICEYCQEVEFAKGMSEHFDVLCERFPLDCQCGQKVPRNEFDEHLRSDCPHVIEVCEFCEKSIRRGDMAEHRANATEEHMRFLKELVKKNALAPQPVVQNHPTSPFLRQCIERMSRRRVAIRAANAFFIYYVWMLLPYFVALPLLVMGTFFYAKTLTERQTQRRNLAIATNKVGAKPMSHEVFQRKKRRNLAASAGFVVVSVHFPLVAAFLPIFGRD